jgi:uncharacterized repeat protein (TIGR01451 family)/fimbrial isopeptide formation D2 family protein
MLSNLGIPTQPLAQSRFLFNLNVTQKALFTLLLTVLVTVPLWLGLERVHSSPAKAVNPSLAAPPPIPRPVPSVTLKVPAQSLIGEEVKFRVTFKNLPVPTPGVIGYGPFIDLVLDAGGANIKKSLTGCTCDGITFVKAEMIGVNGGPLDLTPPLSSQITTSPCGSVSNTSVVHPFAASGVPPVSIPPGAQLVTIALPFGSYSPTPPQPDIVVEVTAQVSNFADYNVPLRISARGGFRYGSDALNNPSSGDTPILSDSVTSTGWKAQATTTPTVMIIKKEYSGPEDETATGPNFPRQYKITVDIANGQTINNLKVQDILPSNMLYQGLVSVMIGSSLATQLPNCPGNDFVLAPPSAIVPGGSLVVSFCNPIKGTGHPDVTVTFTFYIPELDASGKPVLQPNCTPVLSVNSIRAEGDWSPLDPCDKTPVHVVERVTVAHTLADKCLAIQKNVTVPPSGPRPGDILKYDLQFQVSDYMTIGKLVVNDFLADGQDIVPGSATLTVSDQFGTKTGPFPGAALTSTPDPTGALKFCPHPIPLLLQAPAGGTVLTFDVSLAMGLPPVIPRQNAGILTGGYAAGLPSSPVPATGTITFFAKIRDDFALPVPGDKFVDKDDPINNCVVIAGQVYRNVNRPNPINSPSNIPNVIIGSANDNSATHLMIVTDTPRKSVYAVKSGSTFICGPSGPACSNAPNPPQEVRPGDQVTFRIEKTIPSSDAERLTIQDWLPLPIFDVAGSSFTNAACVGIPGPGTGCLGPTETLRTTATLTALQPTFRPDPTTNSIIFNYGSFNDKANRQGKIDLLFTSTVTNQPFADGLFLTNEAEECENNSFNFRFCQVAIAQVNVREPNLQIQKGVIATDNPNGQFSPPGPPPTATLATAQAPSGATFSLAGIAGKVISGSVIHSDLSNVDANDLVTFAIVIENKGGHPAYDVQLTDTLPSCFTNPTTPTVQWGDTGLPVPTASYTPLVWTGASFSFATKTPASIPASTTTGANIIVITFQAQLVSNITPGCCDNVVELQHYASQPGGPDFVTGGFTPPFEDKAEVCVEPTLVKSVVATSEVFTKPQASATPQTPANTPRVAIGEIVRYRLAVVVPEGGPLPNFQVTDALPAGMEFLNDNTARIAFVSNGTGILHPSFSSVFNVTGNQSTLPGLVLTAAQTVPALYISAGACGAPVTFKLGNVQNKDNDPDLEYIVIEFNALVCNVASNQDGTTLPNTFSVSFNNTTIATSPPINVTVVEPHLDMTKTFTPANPASPASFTVTLTNTGSADAFDVHLTDNMPGGLTLLASPAPSVTVSPAACSVPTLKVSTASGGTLTVDVPQIPPSCTITLKFWVGMQGPFCGTNRAQASYSSLPGPVGTQPNPTGSVTPCSNQQDCERIYYASAQVNNTVGCPQCVVDLPQGMVAWWPLDEPNGATVVNDLALFNNQGVPKPGSPLGSPNAPGAVSGEVSGALSFDPNFQSSGPHIEVPDHPEINFGTGNLSIDAWVFVPKPPAVYLHPIVDKLVINSAGTQGTGYAFYLTSSFTAGAQLQFVMGNGGPLANYVGTSTPVMPFGTWTHVAVTVNRSKTVTFYVNGAPSAAIGPATPAGSINNTLPLLIGESRRPGVAQAAITLDEIEMFSSALQPNEIKRIFSAGSSGKCKCLLATNETITPGSNGTFSYTFTLTNISSATVSGVTLSSIGNVTMTPGSLAIPPLPPGGSTTVTVTIGGSGAVSGAHICFSIIGITGPGISCRVAHCITL